jgi:hypothetical protein
MATYRLYCLNGGGQVGLADWIEAPGDEEAIAKARKLRPDASKCEIWRDKCLVATLSDQGVVVEGLQA